MEFLLAVPLERWLNGPPPELLGRPVPVLFNASWSP